MGGEGFFFEVEADLDALAGEERELAGLVVVVHDIVGGLLEFEVVDVEFEEGLGGLGAVPVGGVDAELAADLVAEGG